MEWLEGEEENQGCRSSGGEGVKVRKGGVLSRYRVMMRIPSACSLRSWSVRSAEEHQGRKQALNLIVTLKLLTIVLQELHTARFIQPGQN